MFTRKFTSYESLPEILWTYINVSATAHINRIKQKLFNVGIRINPARLGGVAARCCAIFKVKEA